MRCAFAFLGAHCHDRIGEFQKMGLPHSVCPDDNIETWGEGETCPFENCEIPDPERLKHWFPLRTMPRNEHHGAASRHHYLLGENHPE